jgi:hypothetical protein
MHVGQKSYSIHNNQVCSLIFYNDEFLAYQKHFHIPNNQKYITAFKNSCQIRVFLSKLCKTTLNIEKTVKTKSLIFQSEKNNCPFNYLFVGAFFPCQIYPSQNITYPYFVSLDCNPLPKNVSDM